MGDIATMQARLLELEHDDRLGLVARELRQSHREVLAAAAQRAAWMQDRRVDGPFHVGVLLDNCPEYVYALHGAALIGATIVGANSTHRGADLARDLAHTDCQLLITSEQFLPLVEGLDLGPAIGVVRRGNPRVLIVDDPGSATALDPFIGATASGVADPSVDAGTLSQLIFTSGTSGAPKAVKCSQGRLVMIGSIMAQMFGLTEDDVFYCAMPLFHSNAIMACYSPAVNAHGAFALPEAGKFSASGFLPDVRRSGATFFNYVGKPLAFILATEPSPQDTNHSLRIGFGNEGSADDRIRFSERFGVTIIDGYGSTEGGLSISRTPDTPASALGVAPEGTMVIDQDGNECPRARFDEHGRLLNAEEATGALVSAPNSSFEGYYKNPEADAARMKTGRFHTGDLAYRDEAGFFYFAGRDFDWLRVDGENFASAPVEGILARHPDVMLAAVYAVPDPIVGDQVMAALQLRPGATFDGAQFAEFLETQSDLGTKWAPAIIRICDELPITATTKVLKQSLRKDAWNATEPTFTRSGRRGPYAPMMSAEKDALTAAVGDRLA